MDAQLLKYRVVMFYADTPVGTIGSPVKEWVDGLGYEWVKLFFGVNKSGQRLCKSFPKNVLEVC